MAILAAVDGGIRDIGIVQRAEELATALDENLVVLHVISDETFDERRESRPDYYQDDAVEDATQMAKERTEEALGLDDVDTEPSIQTDGSVGKPAVRIQEKAKSHDASYIVMGARKRSPVGKALFGSITQSVLLNADRPVVTIPEPEE